MKTALFTLCLGFISGLTLPAQEFLLTSFELAGMPVDPPPPPGTELRIEAEEHRAGHVDWAVYTSGRKIGYLPARFRVQIQALVAQGTRLNLRVKALAESPRPGQFLTVGLWITPRFAQEDFPSFDDIEDPIVEWAYSSMTDEQ